MRKLIYTVMMLTVIVLGAVIRAESSDELGNVSRQIIISGENKYKAFLLDESIYKYAKKDLSDLRISNSKGINVPYYIDLRNNENASLYATKPALFTILEQERQTHIQIQNQDYLKIERLVLVSEGIFRRRYKVMGTDEEGKRSFLKSGEIYNLDFKETNVSDQTVCFDDYEQYRTLHIYIYNEDDQPLTIKEIKMDYWVDQVVFAAEHQETYTLWYDNKEALKPSYDIEEFRGHITKEPKDLCTLTEPIVQEVITPPLKKTLNVQVVFNILIVITAGVLIVIVFKKLKNS